MRKTDADNVTVESMTEHVLNELGKEVGLEVRIEEVEFMGKMEIQTIIIDHLNRKDNRPYMGVIMTPKKVPQGEQEASVGSLVRDIFEARSGGANA